MSTMYGDADRNAVEAALDADGEGSAIAFDLDQLAYHVQLVIERPA